MVVSPFPSYDTLHGAFVGSHRNLYVLSHTHNIILFVCIIPVPSVQICIMCTFVSYII